MKDPTARTEQPRNPLHGVTLEAMVRALEAHFGWEELARQIPVPAARSLRACSLSMNR